MAGRKRWRAAGLSVGTDGSICCRYSHRWTGRPRWTRPLPAFMQRWWPRWVSGLHKRRNPAASRHWPGAAAAFSTPCYRSDYGRISSNAVSPCLRQCACLPATPASRSGKPGWRWIHWSSEMCLALPVKVIELGANDTAIVDLGGVKKEISLALLDDVNIGDYVILHVGYALSKLDPEEAEKTLALFAEMNETGLAAS